MLPLLKWIKNQIVRDVPEEMALCEFNCHKQQCEEEEWQTCPRRIAEVALMRASGSKRRRDGGTQKQDSLGLTRIA